MVDILELVVLLLEEHIPAMAEEMVEHLVSECMVRGVGLGAAPEDIPEQAEMQVLAHRAALCLLVLVEPAVVVVVVKSVVVTPKPVRVAEVELVYMAKDQTVPACRAFPASWVAAVVEEVLAVVLEAPAVRCQVHRTQTTMVHLGLKQQYQAEDRMAWPDDMVLSIAISQAVAVEVVL